MTTTNVLVLLTASLVLSFLFWIFAAYGSSKMTRYGVCSVCGAVATIWGLNLVFQFLPGWVTLLLMGQSVTGGSAMLRDATMAPWRPKMDLREYTAVAQVVRFGFILAGTLGLGLLGLVYGVN